MAKVSIIVPVYNMEKYLEKSLPSFLNQTEEDIEIILVDDGSKDESYNICKLFADKDDRIKIIRKENAGVSEARNTGIDNASADFIMFADPDDWMELNCCELMLNEQKRTNADMVLADVVVCKNDAKLSWHIFSEEFTTSDPMFMKQYQKTCIGYSYNPKPGVKWRTPGLGSPWNKLFRRSIIEENNLRFDPYVKGIYDDNLFTLHYLMYTKTLSYIQKPVYNYLLLTGSITRSYKANSLDISERIYKRINDFIDETGDRPFFEDAFYIYVIRRFLRLLDVYFCAENNPKSKNERYKEMRDVMNSEPYRTAFKTVKLNMLLTNHKYVAILARVGSPRLIDFCVGISRKH
ncbi:MAG: glycosyltransferase family 2 protein [Eubacteriales bacterium]|nr:glycosyltransferase family 2 protein [Eubacteriales bacterium]